jgi:hypothetical protein
MNTKYLGKAVEAFTKVEKEGGEVALLLLYNHR